MKTLVLAAAAALSLTALTATANADTFTVHGIWDKIWADKNGK